jgi:hypothetical protein
MSAAQQVMVGAMRPGLPAPGLGWDRLARALVDTRPWERLEVDEALRIRDAGGELDGWVVTITGPPMRLLTLTIFPDLESWQESWSDDPEVLDFLTSVRVELRPPDPATAGLDAALKLQPIVVEGQELGVLATEGGQLRTPPVEAQRALLRACEAAVAALRVKGEAPARGAPPVKVPGQAGLRVERVVAPPPAGAAPALRSLEDDVDYVIYVDHGPESEPERFPDRLVLRALKRDCPAIIAALQSAAAVELRLDAQGAWRVSAWPASGPGIALGRLPLGSLPAQLADGGLEVAVASGGAKVGPIRVSSPPWRRRLPLRCLAADGQPFAAAMDEPDPFGGLQGATWAGPPAGWPPMSAVLLAFLGPLLQASSPVAHVEALASAARWVWEISAAEAEGRDSRWARSLLRAALGRTLSEGLLQRKARHYAKDLRYVGGLEVTPVSGAFTLAVKWLPLSGPARAT